MIAGGLIAGITFILRSAKVPGRGRVRGRVRGRASLDDDPGSDDFYEDGFYEFTSLDEDELGPDNFYADEFHEDDFYDGTGFGDDDLGSVNFYDDGFYDDTSLDDDDLASDAFYEDDLYDVASLDDDLCGATRQMNSCRRHSRTTVTSTMTTTSITRSRRGALKPGTLRLCNDRTIHQHFS